MPPAIRASTSAVIAILAMALPMQAQWQGGVELGGAHISQSTYPSRIAATAQASVDYEADRILLGGGTALTMPASGRTRVYAAVAGALRTPPTRRHGIEVSGFSNIYDDGAFPRADANVDSKADRQWYAAPSDLFY